jgi:hypothetical protein
METGRKPKAGLATMPTPDSIPDVVLQFLESAKNAKSMACPDCGGPVEFRPAENTLCGADLENIARSAQFAIPLLDMAAL